MKKIKRSIKRGLNFLVSYQNSDGGFLSLCGNDWSIEEDLKKSQTTFYPSLILHSLCYLNDDIANGIKIKLRDFLLSQKSDAWTFNYWSRMSMESFRESYPDDLDDTFCGLSALLCLDSKIIDGEALAMIVNILTFSEKEEGGPYYTWIASKEDEKWKDIDLAVNCNVAYFLSLIDVSLENIDNLVDEAIMKNNFSSPYYVSKYPVIYFLSRFYKGRRRNELISLILKERNEKGCWGNATDTCFACLSLMNLGFLNENILRKSIVCLVDTQDENGSFGFSPVVIEKVVKGEKYLSGSPYLTTAFCVEFLQRFSSHFGHCDKKKGVINDKDALKIESAIDNVFLKRMMEFGFDNRKSLKIRKNILGGYEKNVCLLPFYFRKFLDENGDRVRDELVIELGLANLYGWLAYSVYDDFADGSGNGELMSLANIFFREVIHIFEKQCVMETGFEKSFKEIMDSMERANLWENENCRVKIKNRELFFKKRVYFENYDTLAQKSFGHCLCVLAILFMLGLREDSKEMKNIKLFFRYFIIARQINDDMHDWEDDLRRGRINCVSAKIVDSLRRERGIEGEFSVNLRRDISKLRKIFWDDVVIVMCDEIMNNCKKSLKCLKNSGFQGDDSFFRKEISFIEGVAQKTVDEISKARDFADSYGKTNVTS